MLRQILRIIPNNFMRHQFARQIAVKNYSTNPIFENNLYNPLLNKCIKSQLCLNPRIVRHMFCTSCNKMGKNVDIEGQHESRILTESNEELEKHKLGKVTAAKMFLNFTCTVCDGPNSYTISKQAYVSGVVIVTCETCQNHHLIADNLGWFEDVKGRNIEEILAEKGEKVNRFISSEVKEVIPE
ncbi:unnamed protein product [Allacma fusca]|uniref:DNL-type domain-containing protein n=1 Tax=Allacma fusca TaxID=39272 RepID=A0A8J2NPX5_9HEXA|nr:unnamed protein product [Allacma fusca]